MSSARLPVLAALADTCPSLPWAAFCALLAEGQTARTRRTDAISASMARAGDPLPGTIDWQAAFAVAFALWRDGATPAEHAAVALAEAWAARDLYPLQVGHAARIAAEVSQ